MPARRVSNLHERTIAGTTTEQAGALLATLGTDEDCLWPTQWPPMRFDGPVARGARGGHGPIRYSVDLIDPGRRIRFRFSAPRGFDGFHEFTIEPAGPGAVTLRHRLGIRPAGWSRLSWPLLWRPLHDALIEDCLDRAERTFTPSAPTTAWPRTVRALRSVASRAARSV